MFFLEQSYGQSRPAEKENEDVNFEALEAEIAKQTTDTLKLQIALRSLQKAKDVKDTLLMANAYYFLSRLSSEYRVAYADSLIDITTDKGYSRYPSHGYLQKGNDSYFKGNHEQALEFYLTASEYAKKNGNEYLYRSIKFNIALLKNAAGEREDAKGIFVEYVKFLEDNPNYKTSDNYNRGLFALADAYIHSKELDLAKKYIDKGIQETLNTGDILLYSYILVTSGIHQYLSKNYTRAIDSLKKGKKIIQQKDEVKIRVATCDYYIARSYQDLGKTELSISYFKSVDTILSETEYIIPELMNTYDYLIKYYKSKGDSQQQINYINTLLRLDSIQDANQLYLTKNINERYDTAELIEEKQDLIDQLEREKFLKENTIVILILFLSLIGILAGYGFRRSYINKKRFEALLEKQNGKAKNELELIGESTLSKNKEEIDIPEDVVQNILKKLYAFEKSYQFSKRHYTLNSLAKELNTNSAYLSKIINVYKNINFANYLNNLRVDFAVNELTNNKSLRSYTIKAIAEEVGFKNAQSFSSAFYKKTGIYPSYFIKQLNN
ncbi:hypothetical protein GCM10022258_23780 [Aquimarina gracilis]